MAQLKVFEIDPLGDLRWRAFLEKHSAASAFHTPEWLTALRRTYGYKPVAWTTGKPGKDLKNGVVFCLVDDWLTGRRLVSLPFSDHCQPLVDDPEELRALLAGIQDRIGIQKVKYLELRPRYSICEPPEDFAPSQAFRFHWLGLEPDLATLFGNLHKDSIQRKIRRAEREGLSSENGRSEGLLRKFYHLFLLTRRRHCLPPQPLTWFRNVLEYFGENAEIRIASKGARPAAAIMTLRFRDTVTYKYGCSDKSLSNAGGMPFLMWKLIEAAKRQGLCEVDLGRSDEDNPGLITFKNHLGAKSVTLRYIRCPALALEGARSHWKLAMAKKAFGRMPLPLLRLTGELLYRHIG